MLPPAVQINVYPGEYGSAYAMFYAERAGERIISLWLKKVSCIFTWAHARARTHTYTHYQLHTRIQLEHV